MSEVLENDLDLLPGRRSVEDATMAVTWTHSFFFSEKKNQALVFKIATKDLLHVQGGEDGQIPKLLCKDAGFLLHISKEPMPVSMVRSG